ncbi:MAG TPA: response regulator transcription factor [Casimicrobiaceae bacterium]|nr:response regulator transcription factor [Casimicrobiaceae bacterium]
MASLKILAVDDHPLIGHALAGALPHIDAQVEVLTALDRGTAITALARHRDVALVLLDLALPGVHGLAFLAELRRDYPHVPIIVLSATHDRGTVSAALAAGARGYVAKTASPAALLDAMRTVLRGGREITRDIAPAPPSVPGVPAQALGLTQRQGEVLRLLLQGKPNKLICRDLRLSEGTVKVHVSAILKALNVHSRAQVIAELARRGLRPEHTRPGTH